MAAILRNSLFLFFFFFYSTLIFSTAKPDESTIAKKMRLRLKVTKFPLYWHDKVSGGSNATSITVIPPPVNTTTMFGMTRMIDNALRAGPDLNSTELGRAQGCYMATALAAPVRLMMLMNFVFSEGKYKGSSITLMGTNMVFSEVRELAVVGGSKLFRFARGYAKLTTYSYDPMTGDAVVKYRISVMHY